MTYTSVILAFNCLSLLFLLQTYVPLTAGTRSGDGRKMSSPPSSSSSYLGMQSLQQGEKLSKTNLYIRGLPPSTGDEDLVNMCKL